MTQLNKYLFYNKIFYGARWAGEQNMIWRKFPVLVFVLYWHGTGAGVHGKRSWLGWSAWLIAMSALMTIGDRENGCEICQPYTRKSHEFSVRDRQIPLTTICISLKINDLQSNITRNWLNYGIYTNVHFDKWFYFPFFSTVTFFLNIFCY